MNDHAERNETPIDLGAASAETKGGPIPLVKDELGFYDQASISDD